MYLNDLFEVMNLYNLHTTPDNLSGDPMLVPDSAFELLLARCKDTSTLFNELKKREHLWAQSAETAYKYAMAMNTRFIAGEPIIAKEPMMAYLYAKNIIKGRWPPGEKAIFDSVPFLIARYHENVLDAPN